MNNRGFTLIEILIAMAVTAMSLVFVAYFVVDISNFGTDLGNRLETEFELQLTLRAMISEIRSMGPGGNGAYPIATATPTTFTFIATSTAMACLSRYDIFSMAPSWKKA